MSKKNRPSSDGGDAPNLNTAPSEASVRQLIANGKCKVAVETAKEIYKAQPTAASEALLVDAYAARIHSLVDQNMTVEAKALLDLVRERYPSAKERLTDRDASSARHAMRIEDLVRPLNDPEIDPDRRAAIEAAVAREGDLGLLAECAALPAEHPLRTAASALHRAFLAVTAGPVDDAAIALPEVSHRSPLAPWKMLVRTIALFYRGDEEACRRSLEAIRPESAPARLIPAIHAMLGDKAAGLTAGAASLVSAVVSDPAVLRRSLEELERAFGSFKEGLLYRTMREAVQACRESAPDQLDRLKQHIAVRCAMAGLGVRKTMDALGGAARQDAYYLRLFARGMEEVGEPQNLAMACSTWEVFRRQAVSEGWFAANGPEAATLYLHMAGVLRNLPEELLEEMQEGAGRQNKKSAEELYFLYPDKLYARACAIDPHFDSFSQWLEWAKRRRGTAAEDVAKTWHKVRPVDLEPLLFLIDELEKRNAFHTSLQYLAKAENIDSVHPAVRSARLRLLAGAALRHIQQKKLHLAAEKLAEMEALPQCQQGDRPAFLAASRYLLDVVRGDYDKAAGHRAETERLMGSTAAAALLIFGVADTCKRGGLESPPRVNALDKTERAGLPATVIRVIELVRDVNINGPIPYDWLTETTAQFARSSGSLSVGQLRTLAEIGLTAQTYDLAYAASGAGLERGAPTEAKFLLLRARSLPQDDEERLAVCAAAAAQLAREHRQIELLDQAVELTAHSDFDDLSLTAEQAAEVVRKEKAARQFSHFSGRGPDYSDILDEPPCNCPNCRAKRGEAVSPFGEDDGEDPALADLMNEIPPDMPPEIAKLFIGETQKAVERGEPLDSLLDRLLGPGAAANRKRKKGGRR